MAAVSHEVIRQQYRAATEAVAIHDSSHIGRVGATGKDVLDLLNRLSTNRVDNLDCGKGSHTVLTNEKGRFIDVICVYNLGTSVLMLTGPGAEASVIEWIDRYTIMEDSSLRPLTLETALFSVIGPRAREAASTMSDTPYDLMTDDSCIEAVIANVPVVIVPAKMGPTVGYHIMMDVREADQVWRQAIAYGTMPIGSPVWDVIRIENGVPLYGKETTDAFNPLETGLIGVIDFTKGCYIGQEVIARLDSYAKVQKHLVTITCPGSVEVREGDKVYLKDREVGVVTSIAQYPMNSGQIGLAYVKNVGAIRGAMLDLVGQSAVVEVTGMSLVFGDSTDQVSHN